MTTLLSFLMAFHIHAQAWSPPGSRVYFHEAPDFAVDPALAATVGLQPYRFLALTADLPRDVHDALRRRLDAGLVFLADPQSPYSEGCIETPGLPRLRLVQAALSPTYGIVEFEEGGFATTTRVALLLRGQYGATVLGIATSGLRHATPPSLLEAIRSGSIWDH